MSPSPPPDPPLTPKLSLSCTAKHSPPVVSVEWSGRADWVLVQLDLHLRMHHDVDAFLLLGREILSQAAAGLGGGS